MSIHTQEEAFHALRDHFGDTIRISRVGPLLVLTLPDGMPLGHVNRDCYESEAAGGVHFVNEDVETWDDVVDLVKYHLPRDARTVQERMMARYRLLEDISSRGL